MLVCVNGFFVYLSEMMNNILSSIYHFVIVLCICIHHQHDHPRITVTIIFSIIITIFAVDGVTVERALVLVASEKGLAYWAYKWTHSPARVHMDVYRKVYIQKIIQKSMKKAYWAYKWSHSSTRVHMKAYRKVKKYGIKRVY